MSTAKSAVLRATDLVKAYGHVRALNGVSMEVREDEIVAIVGDNGAGKSTLIKVLSGALTPDSGVIELNGTPTKISSPLQARQLGIETVYQDLSLAPALDIASNLFLGRELRARGLLGSMLRKLDKKRMREEAEAHLARLGVGLRWIGAAVEDLSGGQRQAVAVCRAVSWGQRVVVMDEPTAALGVRESAKVLELIRSVRDRGTPVIVISHSLPDVFSIADRIVVLRLGAVVGELNPSTHTIDDVVAAITGSWVPT